MTTQTLFLCETNPTLARMAEALARARAVAHCEILRAPLAQPPHPMARRVLRETDVVLDERTGPERMEEADVVVALRPLSPQVRSQLPGCPAVVDWNVAEARFTPSSRDAADAAPWRTARDALLPLIADFFERGYAPALTAALRRCELMADHIGDGIVAHTADRRIFFFNKAAETITGYRRDEVINRDCHSVFPGKLCGGKCLFCDVSAAAPPLPLRRMVRIAAKSGEERDVDMTVQALPDESGNDDNVLITFRDLTRERYLERRVGEAHSYAGLVGRAPAMIEVFEMIRAVADSHAPVLLQGESGTGKELVAAAVHNESPRANKLFVPVNCGALPEALLESELFGHVKGSFTGAIRDKKGRFEMADGGTIFLDEIGDLPLSVQVKLLRVLQEGRFERVGGETTLRTTARIVSATNKNLTEEIAAGRFREDLYYRINVVPILLPPLRERTSDIPLLARHILQQELRTRQKSGLQEPELAPETLAVMISYSWPGNVRELQNWIQFALVKCRGPRILPRHLPPMPPMPPGDSAARAPVPARAAVRRRTRLDKETVLAALRRTDGNKVEAARELGVSRATLYRFLVRAGFQE
jgi:sigma-54 dependent transcriptional regulator, acetoin dehydrogenase operon transcriptional activator AcoR